MARTTILPSDPNKRQAWSAAVAEDSAKDQYFSRMIGPEGSKAAIIRKTDLEKGAGDEVTTALVAKFRGAPITEGQKLAGNEFSLQFASHTMRINEVRQGANCGARIEQSRVGFNLRAQGRMKLTDYIKELYEEYIVCSMCGSRGVGNEIQHLPLNYAGYPNVLRAPDTAHYFVGIDNTHTASTLVTTDKLTLATLNSLAVKAKKMLGGQPDNAVKMEQTTKGGQDVYLFSVCPEVMQDIRNDSGTTGWFEAQKALTTKIGKDSELFKGGAGYFNGVLVDEMQTCVKFTNYGAGANVPAARSLFLGANAGFVANGTKGMPNGMTVSLDEDTDDRGHDYILYFEMIFGSDKTAFNSMDYGMITVDSAFTAAA